MGDWPRIDIDADVARAETLPAWCYRDPGFHEHLVARVFARSWHWLGADELAPGSARPLVLLPGCLDEPLALTRDAAGAVRCLGNVCTHRGHPVVRDAAACSALRCGYHGRRFGLDGAMLAMPGFAGTADFPSPRDDLPRLPLGRWGPWWFAHLDRARAAAELQRDLAPVTARVGFLPWDRARRDPARARDYDVAANWMVYVDNYLEGLHIPYVHPALAKAIDWSRYRTECFAAVNLQLGVAGAGEPAFALPADHPEAGTGVAAFYFWCHPNLMLNVYPWGCSVNLVQPRGHDRTRVRFEAWVWDEAGLDVGAGSGLDRVEREDERVVEAVQRGLRSRLYDRGRYSALHERGVHQFHRMIAAAVATDR